GYTGGADAPIASIDGVTLTQSRVDNFTRNHATTVRFLRELGEETIRRGGSPKTPGFVYDTRNNRINSVGIDENPSGLTTVRTMQFASEAGKSGFELDDTAIKSWLQQYTDGRLSDSEIIAMLAQSSRNSMGQFHLYAQLRTQLLAELYQRGAFAGILTSQRMPLTTPAQQWTNFLKLNRQATVDTYGLLVNDYYDQTNADPTPAEIQVIYEEGKERFPDGQSAEPAFRRRETASFEYLMADMQSFIDREVEKLSEEEIRAEYEKRIKGGDFAMPESDTSDLMKTLEDARKKAAEAKAASEAKAATDAAAAEKADDAEKTDDAADAAEMKKPAETSPPAEDKAADDKAADEKAAAQQIEKNQKQVEDFKKELDAVAEEAAQSPDSPSPDSGAEDATPKSPDDAGDGDQSRLSNNSAVRLVAFQDDDATTDDSAANDAPSGDDAADADDATGDADDAAAETEKKADAVDDTKTDSADDAKADGAKVDEPKDDAKEDTAKDDEPKVQSFEDVRQQVAESMVSIEAGRKLDEALTKVTSSMRLYFNKNAIYESDKSIGKESEPPVKPDLKALAKEHGLEYAKIGPHDLLSIRDEPISNSVEMGFSLQERGPPFTVMMYGLPYQGQQVPEQQLFSPLGTVDVQSRRSYVSWKTAEKAAYTPELTECREEVVKAIRTEEARDLARAAADDLVAKAQKDGKTLEDVVPEDKKSNLKKGLGPFSWMQSFGFGGAFLGNVPELDSVGEEFMGKVFSTELGELGVAANLPERVIYIVKPTDFQPSMDELKERFKQPMSRQMAMLLGTEDAGSIYQGFYEAMDERTGFNYVTPEEE
ncbi:MAG: hypothetical protein HKN47_19960, partial [Pirellulaceae bacterium]|nr:hypothetical protein [Pirellulaceae bacterium]